MTTYILTSKEETAVSRLAEIIKADPEPKTTLDVQVDNVSVYKREFEKAMADEHSVLNNVSYSMRKKAAWIDGTRAPSAPSAAGASTGKAHSRVAAAVNQATKLSAKFNMDQGLADLSLGENGAGIIYVPVAAVLDVNEEGFFVPRHTLAVWTRRLSEVAGDPRKALIGAIELGPDGKEIAEGWAFNGYVSHKLDKMEACGDILQQAVAKLDKPFFKEHSMNLMEGDVELVKVGDSSKIEWIAQFMPVVEEPAADPAQPTETPPNEADVLAQAGDPAGTGQAPDPANEHAPRTEASTEVVDAPAEAPVEIVIEAPAEVVQAPAEVPAVQPRRKSRAH